MTSIYFVRHAQPDTRGTSNPEFTLTDTGKRDSLLVKEMLSDKGISDGKIKEFGESVGKRFAGAGSFNIGNIIQKRSFEVRTPETRIITDPETALRIKTKKIDGVTYILVPAGESVSVNGVEINYQSEEI